MHVWSSGAGEPEGQSRAGGMSVHTSPLAGLLCVSNQVPYLHTSKGFVEIQYATKYATGGKGVMEVTPRLLSFMHSHAWFGVESETTKCTSTLSAKTCPWRNACALCQV